MGLEERAVGEAFETFVHAHPNISAQQLTFLRLLQNHIVQNGGIEIDRLYEPPFTNLHAESVDGLFPAAGDVNDILAILEYFAPVTMPESRKPA